MTNFASIYFIKQTSDTPLKAIVRFLKYSQAVFYIMYNPPCPLDTIMRQNNEGSSWAWGVTAM